MDFGKRARNWWGLLVSNRASFEGRRDGGEGQGAGVVQIGVDGGGNVGNGAKGSGHFLLAMPTTESFEFRIFGLGLFQDRDVGVGVFP